MLTLKYCLVGKLVLQLSYTIFLQRSGFWPPSTVYLDTTYYMYYSYWAGLWPTRSVQTSLILQHSCGEAPGWSHSSVSTNWIYRGDPGSGQKPPPFPQLPHTKGLETHAWNAMCVPETGLLVFSSPELEFWTKNKKSHDSGIPTILSKQKLTDVL
jgi:hypothetical protein